MHEPAPPGAGEPPPITGHEPSCGSGASSLFWLFVTIPVLLRSHSEFWMIRWPPTFVLDSPSVLPCACTWSTTWLQSGRHAPT